jgi:hypothetical protein
MDAPAEALRGIASLMEESNGCRFIVVPNHGGRGVLKAAQHLWAADCGRDRSGGALIYQFLSNHQGEAMGLACKTIKSPVEN